MIENLFLCVGAQKSGTTWLHSQLSQHVDIGFTDVKEIHYFDTIHNGSILLTRRKVNHLKNAINNNPHAFRKYFTNISRGMKGDKGIEKLLSAVDDNWYINLFEKNTKKYAADFSPEYALLPKEGFEHIQKVSRNQKIIFLMRDPISRSMSAIQYYFQTHGVSSNDITEDMIIDVSKKKFIVNLSRYDQTIELLKEVFKKEQLKFMFFEDIMSNKHNAINEVCSFLEISDVVYSREKAEEKVNASKKIVFPKSIEETLQTQLTNTYKYMYNNFDNIPDSWKKI